MAELDETTFESRFFNNHPEIREAVSASPKYNSWKSKVRSVVIDGEKLYIRGGDMLRDEDQIMFEWAWENGLVCQDDLDKGKKTIMTFQ